MRRRLDLAASLIATPPVLFLDEPTTGLDPSSRLAMWERISELRAGGVTLLLTTQYLEEADYLADLIAVIEHGRTIALGTADELKRQVGGERIELTLVRGADMALAAQTLQHHVDGPVRVDEESAPSRGRGGGRRAPPRRRRARLRRRRDRARRPRRAPPDARRRLPDADRARRRGARGAAA